MRYTEIVNEYNRDVTVKNYAAKLAAAARTDRSLPAQFRDPKEVTDEQLADMVLDRIENIDPTPNKEYSQALAKMYGLGETSFEDFSSTLADYLTKFHKLKQKKMIPPPRNDFMRYTSVADFMGVVDEYPDAEEAPKDKGTAQTFYQDAQLRIIRPDDEAAACYYGQGTKWCTAAKNHNMFDRYNKQGSMYIILPKQPAYGGEKYQFHFPSAQFMNEQDRPVELAPLLDRFPQLRDVFKDQANEHYNLQFMFTGSHEEFESLMLQMADFVNSRLEEQLRLSARSLAGVMATRVTDDVKQLRPLKSDLKDMLEQDVAESTEFWTMSITGLAELSPEILSDQERTAERLEESDLQEWVTGTNAWGYITDLLEEDGNDDDIYHVAMEMQGAMSSAVAAWASKYWREAIDEMMPES